MKEFSDFVYECSECDSPKMGASARPLASARSDKSFLVRWSSPCLWACIMQYHMIKFQ